MLLKQLSWYLLVPKPTLYRQVREGKVPGKKVGRQWRFLKTPIDKWLVLLLVSSMTYSLFSALPGCLGRPRLILCQLGQ
jgi:excisionase family DNA binding protein